MFDLISVGGSGAVSGGAKLRSSEEAEKAASPHQGGIVAFVADFVRGEARKLFDVMREIARIGIAHPFLRPRQNDAATDGMNEKAVTDALGRGMRRSRMSISRMTRPTRS